MSPGRDQILEVVYASIDELNILMGRKQKLEKTPQSVILKNGAGLDSLGFVNLVSRIEQKCEEKLGRSLVLTQTDMPVGAEDPFETIETLVTYIHAKLGD